MESDQAGARLGASVATAGDVNGDGFSDVVVGAFWYDDGETNEGAAFLYRGSPTGLAAAPSWTGQSDQAGARFGTAVATAGDVNGDGYSDVVVGADGYDAGESGEGRAYVFLGEPGSLVTGASWTATSDQQDSLFGAVLATAGDVNGDGYSDVVVGARNHAPSGAAFVYHGSAGGLPTSPDWVGSEGFGAFGYSVSSAGDVNGDGFADLVVGSPLFGNGEAQEGVVYVYLGSATGLPAFPSWSREGNLHGARFGLSVAAGGDVNGDGFGDVLVVSRDGFEGRVSAFHGSPGGLGTEVQWTAGQAYGTFAVSCSTAGDVNGDGYSDVVVGDGYHSGDQADEGRAHVFHGSSLGLGTAPAWAAEGDQQDALFGLSVATAGDVNGDGFSDLVVGAPGFEDGEPSEGGAFVYHGSPSGLAATPSATLEGGQGGLALGYAVSTAGDVNGDGYSDVVVGLDGYENGETQEGGASLHLGSASGLAPEAAWTGEPDQAFAGYGVSVATAGDVNGDGYADVLVGSYRYDDVVVDGGAAFLYLGNEGSGGRVLAPAQRRLSDGGPVELLGPSDRPHAFRIRAQLADDLAGFAWATAAPPTARLEWEVETPSFQLAQAGASPPATVGSVPLTFEETVAGLRGGALHRWRARFRTNNPLSPVTPWFSVPWNGRTEAKLRTAPPGPTRRSPERLP